MDFRIKGINGQFINIEVNGYSHPHMNDYWDGNWLDCLVRAEIPGITVNFPASLRTNEIASFYNELRLMYNQLSGSSSLVGLDSNVEIEAQIDKLGKLEWQAKLIYPSGVGATIEFSFDSDQSFLIRLIEDLKNITKEFPIKGT